MLHPGNKMKIRKQKGAPDSAWAIKVKKILKAEAVRERLVETCVRVVSQNGRVRVPGTEQYYSTDQEAVWFTGTDDTAFKDFTSITLRELYEALQREGEPGRLASRQKAWDPSPAYALTKLGKLIVSACALYRQEWATTYINHVFNPETTVLMRAMKRYARAVGHSKMGEGLQSEDLVLLLARFCRFVRRACGTWRFINAVREQNKQAQANFDSAREYICYLAQRHSKLLIMRIDLYYSPYYDAPGAYKHIYRFLNWLRDSAWCRRHLPDYLGFIIKCENGVVRGMHWHLMVICEGNEQQNGGWLSQQLGEAWMARVGATAGSYHNCWVDRKKYEYDGLGVLTLKDREKMIGLRAALHYLTKQDCVLKLTNDKTRNFWRSRMSSEEPSKRGRPRTEENSVQLLKDMLGGRRSKYPPNMEASHASKPKLAMKPVLPG